MISKLTLPITYIDHFSLSPNKKYLAVACEIDKMIIIVDIGKCLSKSSLKEWSVFFMLILNFWLIKVLRIR